MSAWLFSRSTDLWVFVAPAVVSLALVAAGFAMGIGDGDTPPFMWLAAVLLVDVAHVWATTYRVYTDPAEVRRRPVLYLGTPLAVYVLGVALYSAGAMVFWRVLAYGATFHFVRQQYGWMVLYRRRAGQRDRLGDLIDGAAIYLATLYPLVWWHAATPRQFHWFIEGDFAIGLSPWIAQLTGALYGTALVAYVVKAIRERSTAWGKHLLLLTTAICWYIGIITFDSDYAFTVTNVLIHGIPYFALVWRYERGRSPAFHWGWPAFYATLVVAALVEEGLWDRLVWHDHPQFFGALGDGARVRGAHVDCASPGDTAGRSLRAGRLRLADERQEPATARAPGPRVISDGSVYFGGQPRSCRSCFLNI